MATQTLSLGSQNRWLADGTTTLWDFNFTGGYITTDTVRAYYLTALNVRVDLVISSSDFVSPFRLRVSPAVPNGATLVIFRDSRNGGLPFTDFVDGGGITEASLDVLAKQAIFVSQESQDSLGVFNEGTTQDLILAVQADASAADASRIASQAAATASGVSAAASAVSASASDIARIAAEAAAAGAGAAGLEAALAATTVGNGASKIGVFDTAGWFSNVVTKTVEAFFAFIGSWLSGREINVFEYMTPTQIASVKAYNFSVDVTAAVQAAWDAGWLTRRDVFHPAGGYKIDAASLVLPGVRPTPEDRDQSFQIYGQGYGNPFSNLNTGGTVFKSVSDRPVMKDNAIPTLPDINGVVASAPTVSPDAQGTLNIHHIRFDGTSTTPVVLLNSASGISEYHHFVIYQRGTGDGLYIGYGATAHFHDFYSYNSGYVSVGLGAARTGVGVNFPNSYGSGLVTIQKCSSRGWHDCYVIGRSVRYPEATAAGKDVTAFHCVLRDFECSVFYQGVTLARFTAYCSVQDGYVEGPEGGYAIKDSGLGNTILHNNIFAGGVTGIILDHTDSQYGGVCAWNQIALKGMADQSGIDAQMSTMGLGRSIHNNTIVWGNSGGIDPGTGLKWANVAGIKITGVNPQLDLTGNNFNPKIKWDGTGNTSQIVDLSTNAGWSGAATFGFGSDDFSGMHIPKMNRGALSIALDTTIITAGGAVALTGASDFLVTFAALTDITSFTASDQEGKLFWVRVTNDKTRFVHGASLKMAGSANFTTPVNGAIVCFKFHSNVAWECHRTSF